MEDRQQWEKRDGLAKIPNPQKFLTHKNSRDQTVHIPLELSPREDVISSGWNPGNCRQTTAKKFGLKRTMTRRRIFGQETMLNPGYFVGFEQRRGWKELPDASFGCFSLQRRQIPHFLYPNLSFGVLVDAFLDGENETMTKEWIRLSECSGREGEGSYAGKLGDGKKFHEQ